jgi:hypothetical protein
MSNNTQITTLLNTLLTPELRNELLGEDWKIALNRALAPYEVKYDAKEGSITKMCKKSDQYNALPEGKERSAFINKIKTILKVHYVGERLLLKAIAEGYWARINGVLEDKKEGPKKGSVKQLNISMMRGDVAASPMDKQIAVDEALKAARENERVAKENAKKAANEADALRKFLAEQGIEVPELEVISITSE